MNPASSSLGPLGLGTNPSSGPAASSSSGVAATRTGQPDAKKPDSGSFRDSMKEASRTHKPDKQSPSETPADKRTRSEGARDASAARRPAGSRNDDQATVEPGNPGLDIGLPVQSLHHAGDPDPTDAELEWVALTLDPAGADSASILTPTSASLLLAETAPLSANGVNPAAPTAPNPLLNPLDTKSGPLTTALMPSPVTAEIDGELAVSLPAVNAFSVAPGDAGLNPGMADRMRLSGLPVQLQVQLENTALTAEVLPQPLTDPEAGSLLLRNPATPAGATAFTDSMVTAQDSLRTAVPVSVTFGHEKWQQLAAERTVSLLQQGVQSADIMLDPPELGPLQVRIQVQHDQAVVQFTSASAAVREALDQTIPRLREMLQEQGMSLLHAGVSDQSSGDSSSREQPEGGEATGDPVANATTTTSQPDAPQVITLKSGIDDFA